MYVDEKNQKCWKEWCELKRKMRQCKKVQEKAQEIWGILSKPDPVLQGPPLVESIWQWEKNKLTFTAERLDAKAEELRAEGMITFLKAVEKHHGKETQIRWIMWNEAFNATCHINDEVYV